MNGYCNNDNGKKALFDQINAVSFAMDDLRLFLDTHPDDEEALALFNDYMGQRTELIGKYTEKYGPVDSYFLDTSNGWCWNAAPMPWKQEAGR